MANIVLYGGTFNPLHDGHLNLCRYLLATGDYDRILLVPAAAPPHKDAPELAPAEHRLALCRLAVTELPAVLVEDWEIARGGKSYTVDTVHHLREQNPDDRLFLLMGSDMFLTFTQWRSWREIARNAVLLVASRTRDDREVLEAARVSLAAEQVESILLPNPVLTVSSTQIRHRIAENSDFSQLPATVAEYCKEHGLYSKNYDLEALRAAVAPLMLPERYHHTLCVERQAVHLAGRCGMNPNKAAAAGILHDVCKNMDKDTLLQMCQSCGNITDINFEQSPQLMHAFAGADYIRDRLGVADVDIQNAVRYHTTGRAGMSLLEKILYVADLTSDERDYPEAEELRTLAERSLDAAMLCSLEFIASTIPDPGADARAALAEYRSLYKQ